MNEQALTTSYSLRVLYRTSGRWINLGTLNDFPKSQICVVLVEEPNKVTEREPDTET